MTLRYFEKKVSMSTTRSFTTGRPVSGAIVIFFPSWSTRILQASRLRPLMSMASEPQMPWAHERRKVSVPSCSALTVVRRLRTRSIGSASTRYDSQCGAASRSGSKRRMRRSTCITRLPGSIDARLGLEPGDRHRLVSERGPGLAAVRERVGEEVDVVALRVVVARVGAPALLSRDRGRRHGLRAIDQVAQLARLEEVRVEDPAGVADTDAGVALLDLGNPGDRGRHHRGGAEAVSYT